MKPLSRSQVYPLRLIALFTLQAGLVLVLVNLYLWWRFHVHLPMHDTAHLLPLVQQTLEQGVMSTALVDWIATHAGAHRIAMTRLLMAVDYGYFGGQNHAIFAATWLSMLALLLVYVAAFRRSYPAANTLLIFVVGLVLVFLSAPSQFWNTINPINSSWYVAFAASALALWLIARTPRLPTFRVFTAVLLLALIAAFSNFAGVLIWLLLPLHIAIRNSRVGMFAALVSCVFVWLYISGVALDFGSAKQTAELEQLPGQPESLADMFQRGATFAVRTGEYLGSPLSIEHPQLANALVLFSLVPLAAGWILLLTQRVRERYHHNVWFELTLTMATLTLGVAIATQLGREFLWQPTAERYQNVVMMYWMNICGLLLLFALQVRARPAMWQCGVAILCVAIAALLITRPSDSVNRAVRDAGRAKRIEVLGQLGISEKALNRRILNRYSRDYLSEFQSFFTRNNVTYGDITRHRVDLGTSHQCAQVNLQAATSEWPGIYAITGTIGDYASKLYRQIPVSTEQGEVVGFIFPMYDEKLTFTHLMVQREVSWEGYFRAPATSDRVFYLHYRSSPFAKLSCRITV